MYVINMKTIKAKKLQMCTQEYKLYQNKLKSKSNHTQKMII
jgi:hypothetical protein